MAPIITHACRNAWDSLQDLSQFGGKAEKVSFQCGVGGMAVSSTLGSAKCFWEMVIGREQMKNEKVLQTVRGDGITRG